jgi:hypothetical protein
MGICSKAKEVICCNQMLDVPIMQDVYNNNSTESKKFLFTKNNLEESADLNLNNNNNNESIKERTKKFFGNFKDEEKNLELNNIKRFNEIANEIILKQDLNDSNKKNERFKSSVKNVTRVKFNVDIESKNENKNTQMINNKDIINELYNENDETGNNDNNKENINKSNNDFSENQDEKQNKDKKRGKSFHLKQNSINQTNKFVRNKRKSATLLGNSFKFKDRLHGLDKSIPVINETLISKNMGNPDKYYKRIKYLGSGSYGSVYMAKNIATDNIVAIKIIEKEEGNMIDDMEIQNEINILKKLSHPNIVKVYEFFD